MSQGGSYNYEKKRVQIDKGEVLIGVYGVSGGANYFTSFGFMTLKLPEDD